MWRNTERVCDLHRKIHLHTGGESACINAGLTSAVRLTSTHVERMPNDRANASMRSDSPPRTWREWAAWSSRSMILRLTSTNVERTTARIKIAYINNESPPRTWRERKLTSTSTNENNDSPPPAWRKPFDINGVHRTHLHARGENNADYRRSFGGDRSTSTHVEKTSTRRAGPQTAVRLTSTRVERTCSHEHIRPNLPTHLHLCGENSL